MIRGNFVIRILNPFSLPVKRTVFGNHLYIQTCIDKDSGFPGPKSVRSGLHPNNLSLPAPQKTLQKFGTFRELGYDFPFYFINNNFWVSWVTLPDLSVMIIRSR